MASNKSVVSTREEGQSGLVAKGRAKCKEIGCGEQGILEVLVKAVTLQLMWNITTIREITISMQRKVLSTS